MKHECLSVADTYCAFCNDDCRELLSDYGRLWGKSFEALDYNHAGLVAFHLVNKNMSFLCDEYGRR